MLAKFGANAAAFRMAYLAIVATAMVGWVWLLFVSLDWVLGV